MTDERPILLGEAPSRGGDRYHMFPLSGRPARVLCTLAGIPPQPEGSTYGRWTWALYEQFECRNLFGRYAQAAPWSVPRARDRAAEIRPDLHGRRVVLLGRRVQAAFELDCDFHEWQLVVTAENVASSGERSFDFDVPHAYAVVAIPHPSGLNRALNDPVERDRCRTTLRCALDPPERVDCSVVVDVPLRP